MFFNFFNRPCGDDCDCDCDREPDCECKCCCDKPSLSLIHI